MKRRVKGGQDFPSLHLVGITELEDILKVQVIQKESGSKESSGDGPQKQNLSHPALEGMSAFVRETTPFVFEAKP